MRIVFAVAAMLALQACLGDDKVAGGSSEVDNPQIKVALVDETGAPVAFTGSVSIFLADQNPALDPDPLVEIQLSGDSVVYLSAGHLTRPGEPRFNLLVRGASGSFGALLDSVAYDSAARTLRVKDSTAARLRIALVPLLRCSASVSLDVNGAERVFVPGTPYQTVVVSDSFSFSSIPEGVFPLRVYTSSGVEREFARRLDTREPGHFALDTSTPPIPRPTPPEEPQFGVNAGADQSVFNNSDVFLSGTLSGVSQQDKRVGVLWRQVFSGPQDRWAHIENPSSLKTRVRFTSPGVYRFVLSVSYRSQKSEDTVTIGVQAGQPQFYEPGPYSLYGNNQYAIGYLSIVRWYSYEVDTLDLEFSPDSGTTWQVVLDNTVSNYGYNDRFWIPSGTPTTSALLRLRDQSGATVATSQLFSVSTTQGTSAGGWNWYGNYYPDSGP